MCDILVNIQLFFFLSCVAWQHSNESRCGTLAANWALRTLVSTRR